MRLVTSVVLAGLAVALICLLVTARSLHSIAIAQSPTILSNNGPATEPFVQAFKRPPTTGPTVRVAVIGGMVFTGFWTALAERYEKETGVRVDLIAAGPKNGIIGIFKQGGVDAITMHSSDAMINLAANGYTLDPQPWMRNDLVIVGPPEDPAGIKGMTDAAAALKKIADAKSPFVVHSSLGAQEVLLNILEQNNIQLDPANTTVLFDDQQRSVLNVAGQKRAYTLVGRIPFHTGRLPNDGLVLMVQGDERLRRPYLVAVTNPQWMPDVHITQARRFAAYLRKPQTQDWISTFGKGTLDEGPVFFPVAVPDSKPPAGSDAAVVVGGDVDIPFDLTRKTLEQFPQAELHVTDRSGNAVVYSGVL
jgi:tungstate transport system substrate-binding protein